MNIRFDELWNTLSQHLPVIEVGDEQDRIPNEVIQIPTGGLEIQVGSLEGLETYEYRKHLEGYVNVVCISRHFVYKKLYTIHLTDLTGNTYEVTTTSDHTCYCYDKTYYQFKLMSAKDLVKGLKMCVYCEYRGIEVYATIDEVIEHLNEDGMFVYDLEVDSHKHLFFANNVLIHNSQFMNIAPITRYICQQNGYSVNTKLSSLPKELQDTIIKNAYAVLDKINENVKNLVNRDCHTTHGDVIHYSLEYIASEGFYFQKKHYIVHKMIEDDFPCNKFKYSGISVKKAEIPNSMKSFLKDLYESTMVEDWNEHKYIKMVSEAYAKFVELSWDDISFFKKYRTEKKSVSITESEKGAGAYARALNIYNGVIEELGISGKYPSISIGDEFRYAYVVPTNKYGVDVIAYKGEMPLELKERFQIDYPKMFEKIFIKSLDNYIELMGYRRFDPSHIDIDPTFDLF